MQYWLRDSLENKQYLGEYSMIYSMAEESNLFDLILNQQTTDTMILLPWLLVTGDTHKNSELL